jgi:hypothetical protein
VTLAHVHLTRVGTNDDVNSQDGTVVRADLDDDLLDGHGGGG